MPQLDLSVPIFSAQAGAATEWGQVEGEAFVNVPISAALKRGVELELGIEALARVEAGFAKYLAAQLQGRVQGQAKILAQVQVPTNLFDEVGLAVRLQAIAEVAAAVRVSIGLSVGDFMDLVKDDPRMRGLAGDLFRVFMEEIEIGAGLFAKVAYTAQAYANLIITGTFIDDPVRQIEPGFNIVGGYGAGFKGGAGYRVFAKLGFKDTSRFVARSVDLTVDATIDEIAKLVPTSDTTSPVLLEVSRCAAKIALRMSYEVGEYIALNDVPQTSFGAQQIAARCLRVIQEECQRYLLRKLIEMAIGRMEEYLREELGLFDDATWESARAIRETVADRLMAMPPQPFAVSGANFDYWHELVNDITNLVVELSGAAVDPDVTRDLAVLWSAAQLMFSANKRVLEVSGAFNVAGQFPVGAKANAFSGPLSAQPHASIKGYIRQAVADATGSAPASDLTLDDLLIFVTNDVVLELLRSRVPEVDAFLDPFAGPLQQSQTDVARLLLISVGSIVSDEDGNLDDRASLEALASGLGDFAQQKIRNDLAPLVRSYLPGRADLMLYFDEVLVPSVLFATDVAFDKILLWEDPSTNEEALKEAFSAVLMRVFGRSLVVTGDVLMNASLKNISDLLTDVADDDARVASLASVLNDTIGMEAGEARLLVRDLLEIGAEVLEPLPPQTRARVRQLVYETIEPMPIDEQDDFLQQLGDDFFVPNLAEVSDLAQEMMDVAGEFFVRFAEKILARLAERAQEWWNDVVEETAEMFAGWYAGIQAALIFAAERLAELAGEIAELLQDIADAAAAFVQGVLDTLGGLSGSSASSALASSVSDAFVELATPFLEDDATFTSVIPSDMRGAARTSMSQSIAGLVDDLVISPVTDALGSVPSGVDALAEAAGQLDPTGDLDAQLRELVLDFALDQAEAALAATVSLTPSYSVSWEYPATKWVGMSWENPTGYIIVMKTASVSVDLPAVSMTRSALRAAMRAVWDGLDDLAGWITNLGDHLIAQRTAEITLAERQAEQSALTAERDTLNRQLDASWCRDLRIVSPAHGAGIESACEIELLVSGLEAHELGLDDEDAFDRLSVVLNGVPLSPQIFTVTLADAPPSIPGALTALAGVGLPTLDERSPLGRGGERVATPDGPWLRVRGTVALEVLEEGVNTINAVVLNTGGAHRSATSIFVAQEPEVVCEEKDIRRLPTREPIGRPKPEKGPRKGSKKRPMQPHIRDEALREKIAETVKGRSRPAADRLEDHSPTIRDRRERGIRLPEDRPRDCEPGREKTKRSIAFEQTGGDER